MALTYTIAGLRTALDAFDTALLAAVDAAPTNALWDAARKALATYSATYAGLPTGVQLEGVAAQMPKPDGLRQQLNDAIAHEERKLRAASNRRLIRARTRYS